MGKESLPTTTDSFMMENILKTKRREKEHYMIKINRLNIKANGRTIFFMGKENNLIIEVTS